mgnify:FL=1
MTRKVDEAQWKKFDQSVEALESGLDEMIREDRRGKNPNSKKNLIQFRESTETSTEKSLKNDRKLRKSGGTTQGENRT